MRGRWLGSVEAILGVIIVMAISTILPGQWGFLGVQPHPLWIVVLAIAIRYGTPSGYVAGVAAAIGQCAMLWLRPEARFQPIPEHALIQPFLFVAVAVVVSHVIQGQRRRLANLEAADQKTAGALHAMTARYTEMYEVKGELEKQIVGLPDSITTLYEVAKRLDTLDIDALYPAILSLVTRFLGAEACRLYRLDGERLQVCAHLPAGDDGAVVPVSVGNVLLDQAIRGKQVITVRDRLVREGPAALATEPVLAAGPLLSSDGAVIGVISIERMPFLKLTPTNVRLFSMILDWGAAALQTAAHYAQTEQQRLVDETTGVYIAAHTMRLVREESLRSQRYCLPLSIVTMHVDRLDMVRSEMLADVLSTVTAIAQLSLRGVDIIGHHTNPGTFVLMLPMTEAENADVVVARIGENLRAIGICPYHDDRLLSVRFNVLTRGAEIRPPMTGSPRVVAQDERPEAAVAPHPSPTLLHFPEMEPDVIAAGD